MCYAIKLRQRGFSLNEISENLGVAKATLSRWLKITKLSNPAKKRLLNKILIGQYIAAENKKQRTRKEIDNLRKEALNTIKNAYLDKASLSKIYCALIYWCEGAKNYYLNVCFINPDPRLASAFINLLRESFPIKENKFRAYSSAWLP